MNLMRAPAATLAILLLAGCAGHEPATGQVACRLLAGAAEWRASGRCPGQ